MASACILACFMATLLHAQDVKVKSSKHDSDDNPLLDGSFNDTVTHCGLHSATGLTSFRKIGTFMGELGYSHLSFSFDFRQLQRGMQQLCHLYTDLAHVEHNDARIIWPELLEHTKAVLKIRCMRLRAEWAEVALLFSFDINDEAFTAVETVANYNLTTHDFFHPKPTAPNKRSPSELMALQATLRTPTQNSLRNNATPVGSIGCHPSVHSDIANKSHFLHEGNFHLPSTPLYRSGRRRPHVPEDKAADEDDDDDGNEATLSKRELLVDYPSRRANGGKWPYSSTPAGEYVWSRGPLRMQDRNKRFAVAAAVAIGAAVFSVVGGILAIFSVSQLSELSKAVGEIAVNQEHLVEALADYEHRITILEHNQNCCKKLWSELARKLTPIPTKSMQ